MKEKKPVIVIDNEKFTFAFPPDNSCYSCSHFSLEATYGCEDLANYRYCAVTNSHNLHTWPFTHTICKKWEHCRAPLVEGEL